jgi:S1-C subfamily serine protease
MSKGIPVLGLIPGCHAERAGIRIGDRIVKTNGFNVNSMDDYIKAIQNRRHSQTVVVLRDGMLIDIEMVIGAPLADGQSN